MNTRHIKKKDFNRWKILFEGYADFYKVKIDNHINYPTTIPIRD
jgi:hypothetical protein